MARPIRIRLLADIEDLQRNLTRAANATNRFGTVGDKVGAVVKRGMALAGGGIVATAGAALKMGGDFQSSMNKVKAVSGATGKQFDEMSALAKKLGSTTQYSANEAAQAMGFLSMAGFDATETMDALPGVLDLAAAGSLDLAEAADTASNILSGYGFKAKDIGRVNDILAKTFTSANVDLAMLGESFKYVGPVASSAGLKFSETSAAIGLLGNAGIQGSEAGTALRGSIARLLKPTGEVSDTLNKLGVSVTDSNGKLLPLVDIVRQLEESGADTADMMAIFGLEAGPAMQALVSQGSKALGKLTNELDNSGGTAKRVAETQMEGFNGAVKRLQSAFEGLMIAIAEAGLLDFATKLAEKLGTLAARFGDWVQNHKPQIEAAFRGIASAFDVAVAAAKGVIDAAVWIMQNWRPLSPLIAGIAALLLITLIPPLVASGLAALATGAQMAAAWIAAMGPVAWIIAAVVALAALILANWDTIKKWTAAAWEWVWEKIKAVFRWLKDLFLNFTGPGLLIKHWDTIKEKTAAAFRWVKDKAREGIDAVVGFIRGLPGRMLAHLGKIGGAGKDIGRRIISTLGEGLSKVASFGRDIGKAVGRGVKYSVNGVIDLLNRAIPDRIGIGPVGINLPKNPIPRIRAMGGPTGGWTRVGERGPEWVSLPRESTVIPNHAAGPGGNVTVNVTSTADPRAIGREVAWALRVAPR
ncbi:phage tail tape measure protein [Streptomyces alkaliterrae]|uniref:Phage tail tape measure protein n=1 Tax=Streptomyces alkaliterrae TaxID=2213162 RepID=A0A5P0YP70_9ACTN|nr:phage tail tape measure protein [Streptomyces alkaliterrae]MBB1251844.1 phage tail tape measure protein [Streptomyces alkaliterrae]MBB1259303.1 phage tail tape measure protein [Streptomyces alkaliterrae]MQS00319.1 phage tail tape measure protein [Streptomyces alkaliterrae]